MKPSRALPSAIVVAALAVASMFAAAPAAAASLPAGAKITTIEQLTDQFYTVNPISAASTPVGDPGSLIPEYVTGVDVDDTGHGYATATAVLDEEDFTAADVESNPELALFPGFGIPDGGYIYKADANTGDLTGGKIVEIGISEIRVYADECSAVDYTGGKILAACMVHDDQEPFESTTYIGYIDYDYEADEAYLTAETVLEGEGFLPIQALAVSPIDGTIWAFDGYWYDSFTVTLGEDELTEVDDTNWAVLGADFDRSGQLWLSVDTFEPPAFAAAKGGPQFAVSTSSYGLSLFDLTTHADNLVSTYTTDDLHSVDIVEAITVWGVLAATGSTMSIAPAIAASGILLLGALMAAGTMVIRRRNADA